MSVNGMDARELLVFVENTLDWYDHVAFHFLLCADASSALSGIETLIDARHGSTHNNDRWRRLLISQWFRAHDPLLCPDRDVLIAALFLLRQWKVLRIMAADVSTVSFRFIDPFRLILFRIVDDLDSGEVNRLVRFMELVTHKQVRNRSVAETAFLFWIAQHYITERDLTGLSQALQSINRRDLVDRFISNRNYSTDKPGFCLILQHEQSSDVGLSWKTQIEQLGFVVQVRQCHSTVIPWKCELNRQDLHSYGCLLICFLTKWYDPVSLQEYVCRPILPCFDRKAQIFIFDHPANFMQNISPDQVGQNVMILWPSESQPQSSSDGFFIHDLFDAWQNGQDRTLQSAVQTLNERYKEADERKTIHQIDNLQYAVVLRRKEQNLEGSQ